jgi:predicted ribosome quality control (RQC) complex YloA/Tae2 family protein
MNEMGDLVTVKLVTELMGKHSNIILCDSEGKIIDSIKHINAMVSSVREVLPGKPYFIPNTLEKSDPAIIITDGNVALKKLLSKPDDLTKAFYTRITGISPLIANEIIYRAGLTDIMSTSQLDDNMIEALFLAFKEILESITDYKPEIIFKKDKPKDFSCIHLLQYDGIDNMSKKSVVSVSEMLTFFYDEKAKYNRIREKSAVLRHLTTTALERTAKKKSIQENQLTSTEKRDKFRHYGELINIYGYELKGGEKCLKCEDYETGKEVTIPLDDTKNAAWNAKHYFDRYSKLKRTYEAVTVQLKDTEEELNYLESVLAFLNLAETEGELNQIRDELSEAGYAKHINIKNNGKKKANRPEKSKPLHYISSDGFDIYVGKNNYQNDWLTFKFASNSDWWFHAKHAAGSHVILHTNGEEPTDKAYEEAAACAAYYSKLRDTTKADIDYIQKKHVKKPNGSKPGFVVYYTNYSMAVTPSIEGLREV